MGDTNHWDADYQRRCAELRIKVADINDTKHCGYPVGDCVLGCDRDHCTPEERAVINTGLTFRQAENAHWVESEVGSDPARTYRERSRAYIEFTNACHALLAARAGKETE